MQEVIGVKFTSASKVYFFGPRTISFSEGDGVIVETSRGMEFGIVSSANKEVKDSEIVQPLKNVIRRATDKDIKQNEDNQSKKKWAWGICHDKITQHKLDMKLIDAEYTFDKSKAIFTFTSEGRVDFRDLVRDLASALKTRIEMRQVYERDDIKMRGALSTCGRVCCCHNHLQDFEKVSIKMAKNQNLSLNPQKISGVCGKLMCCLKYENDYYVETNKLMPKLGSTIKTPLGYGRVDNNNVLKRKVKVRVELEDGAIAYKEFGIEELETCEQKINPDTAAQPNNQPKHNQPNRTPRENTFGGNKPKQIINSEVKTADAKTTEVKTAEAKSADKIITTEKAVEKSDNNA